MLVDWLTDARSYERKLKKEGKKEKAIEIAINLLDVLDIETIAQKTKLTVKEVKELKEKY